VTTIMKLAPTWDWFKEQLDRLPSAVQDAAHVLPFKDAARAC